MASRGAIAAALVGAAAAVAATVLVVVLPNVLADRPPTGPTPETTIVTSVPTTQGQAPQR